MTIESYERNPDSAIVNEILGWNDGPICKHCGAMQHILGHRKSCAVLKIQPSVLKQALEERKKEVRKNANRQIVFRKERPNTVSKQRFRRKLSTRPGMKKL